MTAIIIRLLLFCMCYTIPILKTEEEFFQGPESGSVNEVTDVPDNFKEWIADNSDRIEKATERGTLPCFINDNREIVDGLLEGNNKHQLSQEEAWNKLNALLEIDKPYANPKLVRMMEGKDFSDNYSILEVSEREVIVQTSVGNVSVDLRYGPTELYENLEIAADRMSRHGYEIRLCEKREDGKGADSFNITLDRFEEYKRNKKGTFNSIDMNLKDAAKQANVVVLEVSPTTPISTINSALRSRVKRAANIEEVIIIRGEEETILTRGEILRKK